MPTSFGDSIKRKLKINKDEKTIGPSIVDKNPIEYNKTESKERIDDKSLIDTIGSFSDAQSLKTIDKNSKISSEDEVFAFKKINNQGSLKQIKGEKGDGDASSVKSKRSIFSRLSLRKKTKKEESKTKGKPDTAPENPVEPSAVDTKNEPSKNDDVTSFKSKGSQAKQNKGEKNVDNASTISSLKNSKSSKSKSETKNSDDNKSISSTLGSIKSKFSFKKKDKKDVNDDNKSFKSILSKSKSETSKDTIKDDGKNKSINSKIDKIESEKPKDVNNDDDGENKSIQSSTKSKIDKIKSGKPKDINKDDDDDSENKSTKSSIKSKMGSIKSSEKTKEDKPLLKEEKNSIDKSDTFSFKKLNTPHTISSKIFDPSLKQEILADEFMPQTVIDEVVPDNSIIEPKVIEIVKEEDNESYSYAVKPSSIPIKPDQTSNVPFEPVQISESKLPANHEPPIENQVDQNKMYNINNGMINGRFEQMPVQMNPVEFVQQQIYTQPGYFSNASYLPLNTFQYYDQCPLLLDDLVLVTSVTNRTTCLGKSF